MSHTQTLLQAMLWKQCMTSTEFKNLIVKIMQYDVQSQITDEKLGEVVSAVNNKIRPFNMMIRSTVCEVNRQAYYSLISTVDNPITRMASIHTPKEYEYFKLVLTEIAHNDKVSYGKAKSLSKGLITRNADELLDEWISKLWFVKKKDDDEEADLMLGPRGSAELDIFIQNKILTQSN